MKACLQVHGFLLRSGGLQLSHSLVEVLLQSLGSPVLVLSMLLRSLQSGYAAASVCRGSYLSGLKCGQARVALERVLYPAVWGSSAPALCIVQVLLRRVHGLPSASSAYSYAKGRPEHMHSRTYLQL